MESLLSSKRRPVASPFPSPPPTSVDVLLSSLLSASPVSVGLALERIVDAGVSDADHDHVVECAAGLGSAIVMAADRSRRKIATRHNSRRWPLPADLTVLVFSMLDTKSQCYAAASCSMFNKLVHDPVCYANIDLTSMSSRVNNTVVYRMVQRAGKNFRSLRLGRWGNQTCHFSCSLVNSGVNSVDASVPSWNEKKSRLGKESSGLGRSCLLPLTTDGGAAGALLRSLHLHNIEKMDTKALCEALSFCPSLLDLEITGLYVELRQTLESLSKNCHVIERLSFESSKTGRDDSLKSPTCTNLVNGCPNITTLALRGFKLNDHKVRILVKGFHKLKKVDFSTSYAITGAFLRNLGVVSNGLEVLILRDCLHLKEVEVSRFLSTCVTGEYKSLAFLDISNRDGLSAEDDWYDRCYELSSSLISSINEERPDICLVAEFPSEKGCFGTEELVEEELHSDTSFPSPMTLDSFMTSSESSYTNDQGSGNDEENSVHIAAYGESSDDLEFQ